MWKQIRRKIRAKLLIFFFKIFSIIPLSTLYFISRIFGTILYYFPNSAKNIAQKNIKYCFPELNTKGQNRLLKQTLMQNTAAILEMIYIWQHPHRALKHNIDNIIGEAAFKTALQASNGGILITPHLGSWEMAGLYASSQYPMITMYRPSKIGLDSLSIKGRESCGAITVTADASGVRKLIKALNHNTIIGILPDQDPGKGEGIFVNFFGMPANTLILVSRLAQKFKIPVFLVTAIRNMNTCKFHLSYEALDDRIYHKDLNISVSALNEFVERAVRKNPEQYLWAYKRFKNTPDGSPSIYKD